MSGMKFWLGILIAFMALGGMAMADNTVTINADLGKFIEITAPAAPIGTWNLAFGDNPQVLTGLEIQSNDADNPGWTVSATETASGYGFSTPMKMNIAGSSGNYWGSGHAVPGTDVSLSGSTLMLQGVNHGDFNTDVNINQPVTVTDPAGTRTITIEFDGVA